MHVILTLDACLPLLYSQICSSDEDNFRHWLKEAHGGKFEITGLWINSEGNLKGKRYHSHDFQINQTLAVYSIFRSSEEPQQSENICFIKHTPKCHIWNKRTVGLNYTWAKYKMCFILGYFFMRIKLQSAFLWEGFCIFTNIWNNILNVQPFGAVYLFLCFLVRTAHLHHLLLP